MRLRRAKLSQRKEDCRAEGSDGGLLNNDNLTAVHVLNDEFVENGTSGDVLKKDSGSHSFKFTKGGYKPSCALNSGDINGNGYDIAHNPLLLLRSPTA